MYSLFVYTELNVKIVLFQTIQFSIGTQFSSIWSIDRTISVATTPVRVNRGAIAMKGFYPFPKPFALLEPHHWLFRLSWGKSNHSAEMQLIYSAAPCNSDSFCKCACAHACVCMCMCDLKWLESNKLLNKKRKNADFSRKKKYVPWNTLNLIDCWIKKLINF